MARTLAFFYRRKQLSGEIRRQVADVIGAKVNPLDGVDEDICIGVKMSPNLIRRDKLIRQMGDYYLDFIDHHTCLDWLSHWPETKVIVSSRSGEAFLRERVGSPLTFIPQHHCNIERKQRPHRPVKVVAYVGLMSAGEPPWYDRVNEAVAMMGLEMRYYTAFETREDVVRAYDNVDIQFQWRDGMPDKLQHLKNPLKVINAASFGIPTVSSLEPSYVAECNGHFAGAETLDDALDAIRALQTDQSFYGRLASAGPTWTEPYHLDRVADEFRRLADA